MLFPCFRFWLTTMEPDTVLTQHQRQVHLDFHTSPHIPDVASDFDAASFAQTFQTARVNSVTVFAKCHHGMCYYPTSTGIIHPALHGRDLLGEQIEALHRAAIRAPIYITVGWDEDAAFKHPEWRQLRRDGTFARTGASANGQLRKPGGWRFMNFLHPEYLAAIESHVRELLDNYEVDGFFFDIVFFDRQSCWSETSMAFREQRNLMEDTMAVQARFESEAQEYFTSRFTRIVHGKCPSATLFYNSNSRPFIDSQAGVRRRYPHNTHYEIESLPSGFWGYQHFPRRARLFAGWGKPWLGMTGRFQRMWGDFGGIKPRAALEFECFRSQAMGGANSIGDQLPPRGVPERAAYELIGEVYKQCASAEPFYEQSESLHQIGVLLPHYPGVDENTTGKSEEGAVMMCEESHYDCSVLDDAGIPDGLDLLILPDSVVVTERLKGTLQAFHEAGGRLLLSHRSGFDADGNWALDFLPLAFEGDVEQTPAYWRTRREFCPEMARSDRVVYSSGLRVSPGPGTEILVDRVLPYFRRTDLKFCSHFQTPPGPDIDRYPAVVAGRGFAYFAEPIFREYRQTGNLAARRLWKNAMERLIGCPPFGEGLPTTVLLLPRRRSSDLILTLLHYVPVRKALDIDVIEERMSFAGLTLITPKVVKELREFPSGRRLEPVEPGVIPLPAVNGRLLLQAPGFFKG